MFELLFVWIVTALGLGFSAIILSLMVRSLLAGIGRVVFVESDETPNIAGTSAA